MFLFRLTTETLIALLYRGEWPSGLGHYNENRKVPGSNLTRRSAWLKDQTSSRGSRCSDNHRVSEDVPLRMAQRWPWDNQIAVKKF